MRFALPASATTLALLASASPALAEGERPYPAMFSERPLTLHEGQFAITGSVFVARGVDDPTVALLGTVDYGVVDDLTIGALALPLGLSPDVKLLSPSVYAAWRFLEADRVELAAELSVRLPVEDDQLGLVPGVRGRFFFGDQRLDVGVLLPTTLGDTGRVGLEVPIEASVNLTDHVWLQIQTGLRVADLDIPHTTFIPVGLGLGYTLARPDQSPLADFFVQFSLPTAMWLDKPEGEAAFQLGTWNAMAGVRFTP